MGEQHGVIHVHEYEAINLMWRPSNNYIPAPGINYPIGMQTTRYSAFSNSTYHYFGNEVRSQLGVDAGVPRALQTGGVRCSFLVGNVHRRHGFAIIHDVARVDASMRVMQEHASRGSLLTIATMDSDAPAASGVKRTV
jgi:hypothetical protein